MTRDYKDVSESRRKQKKTNSKSSKTKSPKALSAGFMLFSGIVIGSFVSFLIYLSMSVDVEEEKISSINAEKTQQKPVIEKTENQAEEESRFEFYSILRDRKIEVPVEEIEPEKEIATVRQPPVSAIEQAERREPVVSRLYMLQVGSFTQFKEADKRKANLAFMGVASKIHAISSGNRTMYRVQVGPFGNIKKINDVTSLLKQKKIPSLLVKVKG